MQQFNHQNSVTTATILILRESPLLRRRGSSSILFRKLNFAGIGICENGNMNVKSVFSKPQKSCNICYKSILKSIKDRVVKGLGL